MKWLSNGKKTRKSNLLEIVFSFWFLVFMLCTFLPQDHILPNTAPILYPYLSLLYRLYLLFISNQKVQTKNLKQNNYWLLSLENGMCRSLA